MKNKLWLKILIPCLLFGIYMLIVYTEPDFRPEVSAREFTRACTRSDYTPVDTTAEYEAEFYEQVLTFQQDGLELTYFRFTHDAYSKFVYTMYLGWTQTGAPGELFRTSPDYSRFYYSGEEYIAFLYRNNAEVLYFYGPSSRAEEINAMIETMDL